MDTVVMYVDILSNSARQTAAVANRLGLKTVLVLKGELPERVTGNLLVDYLLGAEILRQLEELGIGPERLHLYIALGLPARVTGVAGHHTHGRAREAVARFVNTAADFLDLDSASRRRTSTTATTSSAPVMGSHCRKVWRSSSRPLARRG